MSAILVLGGAGYIGSHTCKAIWRAGWQPVVLDNLSTGHRWSVRYGPLITADIDDARAICDTVRRYDIREVMHFAAKAYVGESVTDPGKYFRENVSKSIRLLDTLLYCGVERIIFSSSCATYGEPAQIPIRETQPQVPASPYGETKLFVEKMLRWYGNSHGLHWVALRYFNAAGADPEGDLGEVHDPETHLIPSAIEAALGMRSHLEVYGVDYPTPDGTAIRDFTHVTDLASAHILALQYLRNGGEPTALNLGTGRGHSVTEVVDAVSRASGRDVPLQLRPRRAGDPPVLVADASKAARVLGWKPQVMNLQSMVETALASPVWQVASGS